MTDEDRVVAAEAGGEPIDETARDGLAVPAAPRRARPDGVRLVLQRRREPDAVVHPALPLGPRRARRTSTTACTTRGARATSPSTASFADAVLEELERDPDAAVFFHDYHLYVAPRARARARARTRRSRTSCTSRGRSPTTGACCPEPIRRAIHEGLLANDVVSFHTAALAPELPALLRGHRSARRATSRRHESRSTAAHVAARVAPISVDPAEFDELAASERVLAEEARARARPARSASILRVDRTDPSKNVVRGFRAFELYLERASRDARARRDARAARPVAPGHSRVRRVPRRDPARGARASTTASSATAGCRSTSRSRTTSRRRSPRTSSTTSCS